MPTEKKYLDVPLEIKAEDISEEGVFSGYGSIFDQTPDSYRDLVARGAFTETLSKGGRNRTGIPMLWQHRSDQIPGVWKSLVEDTKGLRVEGQLATNTTLGNDVYEIMKLGAKLGTFKLGMSIGYGTLEESFHVPKEEEGNKYPRKIRTIHKAELWENSIVTFPAKISAFVTDIKQIDIEQVEKIDNERDLEGVLRESGLSKKAAQYIVKLCKPSLREADKETGNNVLSEILDSMKLVNKEIEKKDTGITSILDTLKTYGGKNGR